MFFSCMHLIIVYILFEYKQQIYSNPRHFTLLSPPPNFFEFKVTISKTKYLKRLYVIIMKSNYTTLKINFFIMINIEIMNRIL